jgi:hypothetical protein
VILLAEAGPSAELDNLIAAFAQEGGYGRLVAKLSTR